MNFLDAYTAYPGQNSANPFALFGVAQSPLETCKAYRTAGAYGHSGLEAVANGKNRPRALSYKSSFLDSKSEKSGYTSSHESRASRQSWLARRRDALKQIF